MDSEAKYHGSVLEEHVHVPRVDEEEVELLRNLGQNKLMDRVQAALRDQLKRQLQRLEDDIREQEEQRDRLKISRENLGVELYGIQQHLARLHHDLQERSTKIESIQEFRKRKEIETEEGQKIYEMKKTSLKEQESELSVLKKDLDVILDTIRQIDKHSQEMSAEIALQKRIAHKAEGEVVEKEKVKAEQDLYIEKLTLQVRNAADELAVLTSQIDAQAAEKQPAEEALREAMKEMDSIRFEKKALLSQWQSSLTALRRRDEVLAASQASLEEMYVQIGSLDADEGSLRKSLSTAQTNHAKLQENVDRTTSELKFLESGIAASQRHFESLTNRKEALEGTLDATEHEIQQCNVESARAAKLTSEQERARFLVDKSRHQIEDEITNAENMKLNQQAAGRAIIKEIQKVTEEMRKIESSRVDAEYALAKKSVEAITHSTAIAGLREKLQSIEASIKETEEFISTSSATLKTQQDSIDRKSVALDKLNKKWERIQESIAAAAAGHGGGIGSLQAEAANLTKLIRASRVEAATLQRRWLNDQTALVAATTETEAKQSRVHDLISQCVLLTQKSIRLERAIAAENDESRRLTAASKAIHEDMSRINALIAKNQELSNRLQQSTFTTQKEFDAELEELEREAATAEGKIQSVEGEKERLLVELLEAERQIILWEKKITLEREIQETLDPRDGEGEITQKEREVSRAKARLEALKREQEKLVAEMEQAIAKRETIALKHRSARHVTMAAAAQTGKGLTNAAGKINSRTLSATSNKPSASSSHTRIGLRHRSNALRADIASRFTVLSDLQDNLDALNEESNLLESMSMEKEQIMHDMKQKVESYHSELNDSFFAKLVAEECIRFVQRMLQRFQAIEAGRLPQLTSVELNQSSKRFLEAQLASEIISTAVETFRMNYTILDSVFEKVSRVLEIPQPLIEQMFH